MYEGSAVEEFVELAKLGDYSEIKPGNATYPTHIYFYIRVGGNLKKIYISPETNSELFDTIAKAVYKANEEECTKRDEATKNKEIAQMKMLMNKYTEEAKNYHVIRSK